MKVQLVDGKFVSIDDISLSGATVFAANITTLADGRRVLMSLADLTRLKARS